MKDVYAPSPTLHLSSRIYHSDRKHRALSDALAADVPHEVLLGHFPYRSGLETAAENV